METGNPHFGNVPYNTSQEKLKEILSSVGPIVSFEMKKDKEGKPTGFGFCEYRDPQTVEIAIEKFQNYNFFGRQLKVGHSSQSKMMKPEQNVERTTKYAEDALKECLDGFSKMELWTFLSQMKSYSEQNPDQAKTILLEYPQIVKAALLAKAKLEISENKDTKRRKENEYDINKRRKNDNINDMPRYTYNPPPMQYNPPPFYPQHEDPRLRDPRF